MPYCSPATGVQQVYRGLGRWAEPVNMGAGHNMAHHSQCYNVTDQLELVAEHTAKKMAPLVKERVFLWLDRCR
jgi:hypothetical protein